MATDSPGFTKDSQTVLTGLLRFGDCAVVAAAALAAYRLRTDSFALPGLYVSATILGVLLTANFMHMAHVYAITNLRRSPIEVGRVLMAWSAMIVTLIAISYFTGTAELFSRLWVTLWFAFSLGGLASRSRASFANRATATCGWSGSSRRRRPTGPTRSMGCRGWARSTR